MFIVLLYTFISFHALYLHTSNAGRLLTQAKWIIFTEKPWDGAICVCGILTTWVQNEKVRRKKIYELELMHSGTCHPQVPCYCHPRCLTRIYLSSDSTAYSVMTETVNPLGLPILIGRTDKWAYARYVEVKHYSSSVTFTSSIINCGSLILHSTFF